MDGRPPTAESKHSYPSVAPWPRLPSTATTPRFSSASLLEAPAAGHLPLTARLDLLPVFFPHQSSLYATQLLHYNKLISPGRGGGGAFQTPPLPPVLTSPHIQTASRLRSSSWASSSKDNQGTKQAGNQNCHGQRGHKNPDKSDRSVATMGKESQPRMPPKQADLSQPLPSRPTRRSSKSPHTTTQQASSVPSTPHQHARNFSFGSREASPHASQNRSPRSVHSENNATLPSRRPLSPECGFEKVYVRPPRRMPYSLGADRLEQSDLGKIKRELSEDEERKLTTDMRELFDRLKPTDNVKENREKLVGKLEVIFNKEWPGHNTRVHLFGSSGNKLCFDHSDVDICITTEWKPMEKVCMVARLLKKQGMEEVVCVSQAKVPIVKIWDPELRLACDMNVNNTLALENTRMVLTYVEIDERVRPLAMIIKHWTRRRIINDAAFGGTLSSYTWICMIISFLQLRSPPVLPVLHQRNQKRPAVNGHKSEFADDLDKLRGFGKKNKESLGELLFHFFRFYAHVFDYDQHSLSVRQGKLMPKDKWQKETNNMLCVEEPFNTVRNLGNTADHTSFRGLHMELRRAFDLISDGKLEECCQKYEFPVEEGKVYQKPHNMPRPAVIRSSSQHNVPRGGRGGRGGRPFQRGGSTNNRRASSSVASYENSPVYLQQANMPPGQDLQWYQPPPQFAIAPDVFNSALSALQMQEHSLRFQLYTHTQAVAQQQALAHAQRMQGGQSTDRSRTSSFDNPPHTAPLRPEMYMYSVPMPAPTPMYTPMQPGFTTLPSSPSTTGAAGEFRRSLHRANAHAESSTNGGTLRSQSQPASRTPMLGVQPLPASLVHTANHPYPVNSPYAASSQQSSVPLSESRHVNGIAIPSFIPNETADAEYDGGPLKAIPNTPPEEEGHRYVGSYRSCGSSPARHAAPPPSVIPSFGDLGQSVQAPGRRRLSTDQFPHSIVDRAMRRTSRSPSPLGHARAFSVGNNTAPLPSAPFAQSGSKLVTESRPLVVNGSAFQPSAPANRQPSASGSTASEESSFDNPLRMGHGLGISANLPEPSRQAMPAPEPSPSFMEPPVIVNGSTHSPGSSQHAANLKSFNERVAMAGFHPAPYAAVGGAGSPTSTPRQRITSRHPQSGIAPLDLADADNRHTPESQNLSPVMEARTPSPSILRKPEGYINQSQVPIGTAKRDATARTLHKSPVASITNRKDAEAMPPPPPPRSNGIAHHEGVLAGTGKGETDEGPWQRQKPKKRTAGEPKPTNKAFTPGEKPPNDENERKGG